MGVKFHPAAELELIERVKQRRQQRMDAAVQVLTRHPDCPDASRCSDATCRGAHAAALHIVPVDMSRHQTVTVS